MHNYLCHYTVSHAKKHEMNYCEVLRIASHVEHDPVWLDVQDSTHGAWTVPFGRQTDRFPRCDIQCDVHLSILINSAEMHR